jgi:PIN domain nuclease of toxin-antitoxin system
VKVLLDTHALIWFLEDAPELPRQVADLIEDAGTHSLVSWATHWEMAVKVGSGKLRLPYAVGEPFEKLLDESGFELLPVSNGALERAAKLPPDGNDPFNRLLAAEALEQSATLLSKDTRFDGYGVTRMW